MRIGIALVSPAASAAVRIKEPRPSWDFGMLPHEREHFEHVLFQPAAEPASAHEAGTFSWSRPPRACNVDENVDPVARLEWLDDLMFAAIDGDPVALDCAADAWQKTRDVLG